MKKISPLVGLTAKSLAFTIVTVLATAALAGTILNSKADADRQFTAHFTDATSLHQGDDVRMSGVRVGTVDSIELHDNSEAEVTFTVSDDVPMEEGTVAELRFRNLVGQRYLSLEPPEEPAPELEEGHTFELEETKPALDLTVLFNGFQPLLRMLDADDMNALSSQIIAVFQGEDATVEGLLRSTASLTSTLADKDQVIGDLISSLTTVLQTVDTRSDELSTTLTTMQKLVSGLAEDRKVIGSTLQGLGDLSDSVSHLLADTRAPLKQDIAALGDLSENLAEHEGVLDDFFTKLPLKLDRIGRTASYGSWINFYLCSIEGRIPMPEGYMGDLGVKPVAGRCR